MTALTEEQRAFQEAARRFAREQIAPGYMAREKAGHVDRALMREMGALGLIGADLPECYGGLGAPSVTAGLAMEAVSYATRMSATCRCWPRSMARSSPAMPRQHWPVNGFPASSLARRCSASA